MGQRGKRGRGSRRPAKNFNHKILYTAKNSAFAARNFPIRRHAKSSIQRASRMQTKFEQGRFGYACKNGKLYHFNDRHVLVMRGWPQPLAWLKRRSHDWRHDRKFAADLLVQNDGLFWASSWPSYLQKRLDDNRKYFKPLPAMEEYEIRALEHDYVAVDDFRSSFPVDIFREARRYGSRRWHMLCLFARCPGALELSVGNPALAFALASNWVFHQPKPTKPMRAARGLIFRKQKKILEWLGFPGTESVRRIFRKMPPATLTVKDLLLLRAALKYDVNHRALSHLPAISPTVIGLMASRQNRGYLGDKFFYNLLELEGNANGLSPAIKSLPFLVRDTIRLLDAVRVHRLSRPFMSVAEVKRTHDTLVQVHLQQYRHTIDQGVFPPPPYAGTRDIVPIVTPVELYNEGVQQYHCCFVFAKDVARGDFFFYRVLKPVRATLLVRREMGRWIFSDIRKACNEMVPDEIRDSILRNLFLSGDCMGICREQQCNQALLTPQL